MDNYYEKTGLGGKPKFIGEVRSMTTGFPFIFQ